MSQIKWNPMQIDPNALKNVTVVCGSPGNGQAFHLCNLLLNNTTYTVLDKNIEVVLNNTDNSIGLFIKLATEINENVDFEMRQIYMCTSNNDDYEFIDTNKKDIKDLKGTVINKINSGTVYVVEHEYITESNIEIKDIDDYHITIHWYGKLNIYWNEQFGENVPFDITFKSKYKII